MATSVIASSSCTGDLHNALHRLNTGVSIVTALVMALTIIGAGYLLLFPREAAGYLGVAPELIRFAEGAVPLHLRLVLALLPGVALVIVTAFRIRALFSRFARGSILDHTNARLMTTIGRLIIAGGVISMVERTLLALALTLDNPAGQKQLVISLSVNDFIIGLFGLFVLAFAHVIGEGARLADENRTFV
jgi:Protein of unknown function (DUF2975)